MQEDHLAPANPARDRLWSDALWITAIALLYFFVARFSLLLIFEPEGIAAIWPSSGIFLSAILLTRRNIRPYLVAALFFADLAAEMLAGTPLVVSVVYAAASAGNAVLGAWLLRRFVREPLTFRQVRHVIGFLLLTVLLSNALMSVVAALAAAIYLQVPFWSSWLWWWSSDGVGSLLVTPLIMSWAWAIRTRFAEFKKSRLVEGAVLFLLIAFLSNYAFLLFSGQVNSILLLNLVAFPFLVWAFWRFGVIGAATASAVLAVVVLQGTIAGAWAHLGVESNLQAIILVQLYIATAVIPSLLLASLITERKHSEQQTQDALHYVRTLIERAPIGIIAYKAAGAAVSANEAAAKMIGATVEQLEQQNFRQLESWKKYGMLSAAEEALASLHEKEIETHLITTFGKEAWFAFRFVPFEYEEEPHLLVLLTDTTERRKAEEALRASEDKFSKAFRMSPDSVNINRLADGAFLEINQGYTQLTGYTAQDVAGKSSLDIDVWANPQDRARLVQGLRERGTVTNLEAKFRLKDGTIKTGLISATMIAVNGEQCILSITRDISERKRAEDALRASEERLKEAQRMAQLGNWDLDLQTNTFTWSDETFRIFGLSLQAAPVTYEAFLNVIHPEDRQMVDAAYTQSLKDKAPYEITHRSLMSDGTIKFVFERCETAYDDEGRPLHSTGMVQDVTERQQAEKEIKKLNQDLERRARELDALNRAGQMMMSSTLDLDAVLGIVMAEVRDLLGVEGASVLLQEGDELAFVAAAGPDSGSLVGLHIPIISGIAGWVMQEGKAELVGDARNDPRFYDQVDAATGLTTRSLIAVPLVVKGVTRGVIEAINKSDGAFDENDLRLMENIAGSAAIAIENARLFAAVDRELFERERAEAKVRKLNQDLERRAIELTALNKAGQAIGSTLDLEAVLRLVLAAVKSLLEVEAAAAFLRVPAQVGEGEELLLAACRPGTQAAIGTRLPITTGITGSVMQSGQSALINDADSDPRNDKRFGEVMGITANSLLAVPLMFKGTAEGVIEAVNKTGGAFDQHDLEMLEVITHSAATAIQNAQLYRHLEKALQQEHKTRAQLIQAGKLSAMGRMVASVAHEFNNPLQTIKNCVFLIRQDMPPEAQGNKFLDMATSEVQRLSNLVSQLRAVYRPGAADQMQAVELSKILDQVHSLVTPHLTKNRVRWEYTEPPYPLIVSGIPDQLKQVFLNLSLNASDAMQAEGGTLTVSLVTTADGRQVGVMFQDTGPGIDPQDLPDLFDPFFTTKETGTGLGLAICYDIVQKHSGRIEVESQPGQGATFTVWLPLALP